MTGKRLAFSLAAVAVVFFGAGLAVFKLFQHFRVPGIQATHQHVTVHMAGDRSCSQKDSGSGAFAKAPVLVQSHNDTIVWDGGKDNGGNSAPLIVTFPQWSNGHVGTPFCYPGTTNPKYTFTIPPDHDSGVACGPPDAYLYQREAVGGTDCTNPTDPGVIVMQ